MAHADEYGDTATFKIQGALYGKINAGYLYEKERNTYLLGLGYQQNAMDPSFYYHRGLAVRFCIQVDDFLTQGTKKGCAQVIKDF
ncbi:MAG: hypothetical protein COB29_01250 [Sulfitobacter sp.]|nr:MAG: hypothetical protein COB29_01250 [Sulfitobacter sp.]